MERFFPFSLARPVGRKVKEIFLCFTFVARFMERLRQESGYKQLYNFEQKRLLFSGAQLVLGRKKSFQTIESKQIEH